MARGRMIDMGLWGNESFAALPAMGRLLLIGIITLADDQGRFKANPAYLRSQVFPYEDVAASDVETWLDLMVSNGTLLVYTAGNKAYLQLVNWWEYQPLDWARPSDYPPPPAWDDRLRFNSKGNATLTYNWCTKSGSRLPDTCDSSGVPTQVDTEVPTQVPTLAGTQVTKLNLTKLNCSSTATADPSPPVADETTAVADETTAVADGWSAVVESYHKEIGVITESIGDQMKEYYAELGAPMLIDAFKEASRNSVRKWSYVDSILQKWRANGRQPPGKLVENAWEQLNGTPDYMRDE